MRHPESSDHPLLAFLQTTAWLGVGIWTLSFSVIALQLWLQ